MKSSQRDLSAQLKIALIVPVLLVMVTGVFGVFAAADIAGKVICGVLAAVAV